MRVYAVSDLHTDYPQNLRWLEQLCTSSEYRQDVILVAGDVSDSLDTLEKTLQLLAGAFKAVFFVPGNHELWCRKHERGTYDSLGKIRLIRSLCKRLDVYTEPACIGGVWLVPLFAWYHSSWDREPDIPGARPIDTVMTDFHVCSWTSVPGLSNSDDTIARHLDTLNEEAVSGVLTRLQQQEAEAGRRPPVITFSHFLPRQDLIPEKRMLFIPNLAKAAGSDYLRRRVQQLKPLAHIFGHTHFTWDAVLDGVRYVQWPLGYPHEQGRRRDGGAGWLPIEIYNTAEGGGLTPQRSCYWSNYYASVSRDPAVTQLAPWVNT
ncbi:hypothetical protein N2152v2_000318 [Parachlorella kessleri]